MNYREALTYIHALDRFGSRPGLDRVQKLFDRVPGVLRQRFVHVAGTNGKGSVSNMIAAVLREAGYKVGLFISPYIVDFRERIQINNEMISEEELAGAVTYFAPILDELRENGIIITEFEFLTVLGFWIFKQRGCDLVVCEVGMGGLLDSTNLIPSPLCSVITRIALDHTAILGGTIKEIAAQKCGIVKDGCPVAASDQENEAMAVIRETAAMKNAPLYRGEDIDIRGVRCGLGGTDFVYRGESMHLSLIGEHQTENLRCALAAIEALNERHMLGITAEHIRGGLAKVKHPARFELLREKPVVILDGAHNPNGLMAFAKTVKEYAPKGNRTLVIGMLADKDSAGLEYLKGLFYRAIVTNIDNPRALAAEKLAERMVGIVGSIEIIGKPEDAFKAALAYGDDVYICGSLYLASQIRPYILEK
jgi:dihydrofolate synthase/folylpolyglutamate synthase